MRPNTPVRQPVIAGVRRRQLSDLLRSWRRQPRKRSPRLFWSLIAAAFVLDGTLAFLGIQWFGLTTPKTASAERRVYVPHAANAALWEPMRHWAIRVDGKPQLFESACRQAVRQVTGEERFEDNDPLAVAVSWMLYASAWEEYPFLRCEQSDLRAMIYRDGRGLSRLSREEQLHGRYVEPAVLHHSKGFRKILRGVAAKGGEEGSQLSSLERQAVDLKKRLALFDCLRSGGIDSGDGVAMKSAREALREAYQSDDPDLFAVALADFLAASRRSLRFEEEPAAACRLVLENWLNKYRPFRQAIYWSILSIGLLAVSTLAGARRSRWRRGCFVSGLLAGFGCLGWSAAGIVCRAIQNDGVPVCDGAEGILWSAAVAMGVGLLLALWTRDGFIALTGALVGGGGFMLATCWPSMCVENWADLPNLAAGDGWLCLQVLAVISAYSALALAWGVAALTLVRVVLAPPSGQRLRGLASLCTRSLAITVSFLVASALLGGCRAMVSSGTWPAWNTQSLGTLLILPVCAALLYARLANWLHPFGLIVGAVLAFTMTLMGWHTAFLLGAQDGRLPNFGTYAPILGASLLNLSLAVHAILRYYFGKQTAQS